ncbi:MotA/TolQ/ExbB proton channel family protein [Acuticoccus sediminis]|uniref:MotA/TolQ/ExbB proton channel family protein n=1 Tax=Acuticoccus sediminis TaxID=2184697 RepID=A0A8B2NI24_9HYPH|nr:MotA/TolQ/ExbB proton channel family protein [Acuticoccus sediminis]RAH96587.1 MotA/TolQ/ExbB proton channel family protein [Acuticoccus sediminis]
MGRILDQLRDTELGSVVDVLALGGPVVALLVVLSVVAVAVAIAKAVQFAGAGIGRHGRAREAIRLYERGDVDAALARASGSLSAAVIRFGIDAAERQDPAAARDGTESYAVLRLHQLRRYTGLLDTIAQISPLLGLFGTVLGMIEAFQALEGAGAAVDPSILAGGIWVALLTTAVGLAVAMPASVLASWFDGRIENEEVALGALVAELFNGVPTEDEALEAAGTAPRYQRPHAAPGGLTTVPR